MPGAGARDRPSTISGSIRGSGRPARSKPAAMAERSWTVVSYMKFHIGAETP